MRQRKWWQAPAILLAMAALASTMLFAPIANTAPGDIADLGVTKSDSPDPVFEGATLTYTIQVTNLGPQGASGVTVTDQLPSHVTLLSVAPSSGSCDQKGKNLVCEIGDLAADPTKANAATITIQVRPNRAGTITNDVSVDSVETDPISANDKAAVTTKVNPLPKGVTCRGVPATIVGTPGADILKGTARADVIAGFGGPDLILGYRGNDLICSGAGNDSVNSGAGGDRVFGGKGNDRLRGRGGPDLLAGNPGADILKGHRGNDRLRGGRGFDRCYGGAGVDRERTCER